MDQTAGYLLVDSRVDRGAVDGAEPENPSSACSCSTPVSSVYDLSAFGSSSCPGTDDRDTQTKFLPMALGTLNA